MGDNGQGVVGVNWDVRIMPLRFMGGRSGSLSDVVVVWLISDYSVRNHGFDISGYSWR